MIVYEYRQIDRLIDEQRGRKIEINIQIGKYIDYEQIMIMIDEYICIGYRQKNKQINRRVHIIDRWIQLKWGMKDLDVNIVFLIADGAEIFNYVHEIISIHINIIDHELIYL